MRLTPTTRWTGWCFAIAALPVGCGGGGSAPGTPPADTSTVYAHSVVPGASAPQSIVYRPAAGVSQATVTTTSASALLATGTTPVLAEHVEAQLAGMRVVCVSGFGASTNVVADVNIGVVAESAAVLLDAGWEAIDAGAAWRDAVASGGAWLGWENCGVKPEGLPSPSSRLVPTPSGGYEEDVFDGNPGTTFQTIHRSVAGADVAAMLSASGLLALDDPKRPLQLTLRAYADAAGHRLLVESGIPASGAAASARGFVALYVPGS
jgi:hypothetical protein